MQNIESNRKLFTGLLAIGAILLAILLWHAWPFTLSGSLEYLIDKVEFLAKNKSTLITQKPLLDLPQ